MNEETYVEYLIHKHSANNKYYELMINSCINDVQNTIEALQRIDVATHINEYYFDYYQTVLNILKSKL